MKKRIVAALVTGALLLLTLALVWAPSTHAASLSGGAYTYVVDGEEVTFPLDPIVQKEGVLLPLEVFTHFGITVEGALERSFVLTYGPVSAQLTLGRQNAVVDNKPEQLSVAPVRLSGRLFLPAELLEGFGLSFSQESSYVTITRYAESMPALSQLSAAEWKALTLLRSINAPVKADSSIYLDAEFTLLNQATLLDHNLQMSYGSRSRLLGLLETNTLLLVNLSNRSMKSGALQTAGLYLVDQNRNQYSVTGELDLGEGLVSSKLAPAADRMAVLLLPRLESGATQVKLYAESNGVILGQMNVN